MKFKVEHEIAGRIRVSFDSGAFSLEEADTIQYYLDSLSFVNKVKVYELTGSVAITFDGNRNRIIRALQKFSYSKVDVPAIYLENSGRELDIYYRKRILDKIVRRYTKKLLMPKFLRGILIWRKAIKYGFRGLQSLWNGKLDVAVLDGTAITASILRGDNSTAGSIMFLLDIGDILEEWTHKKSVADLARSMSLDTPKVWKITENGETLVDSDNIVSGDLVKIYRGNVIPFDGICHGGEAMVNQASLTGEPLAVRKTEGVTVYAGTVIEEGEVVISVKETGGASRYEKIVQMIEDTEKLKSAVESDAEHLADRFVPYSLGITLLVYGLTRNITKALSVLMVDYSCALKLSTPITVLSAIREAREYDINVKGGKFLEQVAQADTIVFDKTGTLTEAKPVVHDVVSFNGESESELLRIAACLEEHFPHSMAKAVVNKALESDLTHEEMHSKPEYIIAHGIASSIDGRRVVIGSAHFVFDDENAKVPAEKQSEFDALPDEFSHLYMAIDGVLAAVILIEDPLRPEAPFVIQQLKEAGISKIVMMTGDSDRTAKAIAERVGVDEYFSEVLPADKAEFVEKEKSLGRKVIMTGDGINDSPALSAADCGIAISDGAELARDIADVIIGADNLYGILTLKKISDGLIKKIRSNYGRIMGINTGLIAGGVASVIPPATAAFLHNASTIGISVGGMKNILDEDPGKKDNYE